MAALTHSRGARKGYLLLAALSLFWGVNFPAMKLVIGYTMPVWASLPAVWILDERLDFRRVAGLVLGVAGLVFLLGPEITRVGESPLGVVFMLVAAGSWAMGERIDQKGPVVYAAFCGDGMDVLEMRASNGMKWWPCFLFWERCRWC